MYGGDGGADAGIGADAGVAACLVHRRMPFDHRRCSMLSLS